MVLPVRRIYENAVVEYAKSKEPTAEEPTKMAHGGLMRTPTKQTATKSDSNLQKTFAYFLEKNVESRNNRKSTKA